MESNAQLPKLITAYKRLKKIQDGFSNLDAIHNDARNKLSKEREIVVSQLIKERIIEDERPAFLETTLEARIKDLLLVEHLKKTEEMPLD